MEKERLYVFRSLASCIAVTDMTDGHLAGKLRHPLFVEDFGHKTISLDSMEFTNTIDSHDTAALLSSVLKSVQAIVSQTCSIFHTIDSKHTTLVMRLVIPIIFFHTLTHLILFTSEICHCIVEQRLLTSVIVNILEEILLVALGMSHLAENLTVAADDSLDGII